jgi:hypothetical protein
VQHQCGCIDNTCRRNRLASNEYCQDDRAKAGLAQETACDHEWRSTQESYGEDADGNRGVMITYEICTKCRARRDEL